MNEADAGAEEQEEELGRHLGVPVDGGRREGPRIPDLPGQEIRPDGLASDRREVVDEAGRHVGRERVPEADRPVGPPAEDDLVTVRERQLGEAVADDDHREPPPDGGEIGGHRVPARDGQDGHENPDPEHEQRDAEDAARA